MGAMEACPGLQTKCPLFSVRMPSPWHHRAFGVTFPVVMVAPVLTIIELSFMFNLDFTNLFRFRDIYIVENHVYFYPQLLSKRHRRSHFFWIHSKKKMHCGSARCHLLLHLFSETTAYTYLTEEAGLIKTQYLHSTRRCIHIRRSSSCQYPSIRTLASIFAR